MISRLRAAQDIGWYVLILLTPLWINLWGQRPFELPKVTLMRTVVWLLAGLVLADYLLTRRSLRRALRSNPMLAPAGLLAVVLVVTTATAVNWRLSLWGSYDRSQGALTLLTYLLLFLLAAGKFHSRWRARRAMTAMAVTAMPLVLFGLLQAAGWRPFGLVSDARSPLFATLGRANFLGAYLAIVVPQTVALLLTTAQRRRRALWAALLVGQLVVIGLTLARSAWLATAVSLSLFALLWWGPRLARRWQRVAWSGVGLLALSGPAAVFCLGQRRPGSAAARLAIWQGTVELIAQRPLLGYGADALGIVFPRVYPPQLVYDQGREFFVDRAHNLFLDWAVTAGVPGLLAFCLLLILFVTITGRALRRPQPAARRALLAAAVAAVLGNVVNNLVSFDVTPTATATWLLMGIGVALAAPPDAAARTPAAERPWQRWALTGLLLVGIGVAVWQGNGRPLLADIFARSAHTYAQSGDRRMAIVAAERTVARWPVAPSHHLLLSRAYWQHAVADPTTAPQRLPQAEAALLTARRLRPGDVAVWLQTARFYTSAERHFGSDTRALANAAYRQAAALAPNQATIYTAWGRAYLEAGDPETAAPLLRRAVRLDASSGEAYLHLGAAELALGRLAVALADYREAVRLLPDSGRAYAGLATCLWHLDRRQDALQAAAEALRRDPQNAEAMAITRAIHQEGLAP